MSQIMNDSSPVPSTKIVPSLYSACQVGDVARAKILLKTTDPNIQDENRLSPLHYAALNGEKEVAGLLIAAHANVNILNAAEQTPMHSAAANGHGEIIDLLASAGANPCLPDKDGHRPLHLAAIHGQEKAVESLIKTQANLNQLNHRHLSAIEYVRQNLDQTPGDAHLKILSLLRKEGVYDKTMPLIKDEEEALSPERRASYLAAKFKTDRAMDNYKKGEVLAR